MFIVLQMHLNLEMIKDFLVLQSDPIILLKAQNDNLIFVATEFQFSSNFAAMASFRLQQ